MTRTHLDRKAVSLYTSWRACYDFWTRQVAQKSLQALQDVYKLTILFHGNQDVDMVTVTSVCFVLCMSRDIFASKHAFTQKISRYRY